MAQAVLSWRIMRACTRLLSALLLTAFATPSGALASGVTFSAGNAESRAVLHNTIASFSSTGSTVIEQVLWNGDGTETIWVLPINAGSEVALSSDALVNTFDAALEVTVRQPMNSCFITDPSCGGGEVGSGAFGEGSIEPRADEVSAPSEMAAVVDDLELKAWLEERGFALPANLAPTFQGAALEGYGFLVLRLPAAGGSVSSAAVRVTSEGSAAEVVPMLSLPGAGASVNLTVIGNRRYQPTTAPIVELDESDLVWDWTLMTSNYQALEEEVTSDGWLAKAGEPLSPYAFDHLLELANSDPYASGYGLDGSEPAAAAAADAEALRAGLSAGSTWVTRLTTRIPSAGLTEGLALSSLNELSSVDRALLPASETGEVPSCGANSGSCDFMEGDMGMGDEDSGCATSGRPHGREQAWLALAAALVLARKRRLLER